MIIFDCHDGSVSKGGRLVLGRGSLGNGPYLDRVVLWRVMREKNSQQRAGYGNGSHERPCHGRGFKGDRKRNTTEETHSYPYVRA